MDRILRDSFPNAWEEKEFKFTLKTDSYDAVKNWIIQTPEAKAYSSHTALFPLPKFKNIEILPIIFIRHPIVRLFSGYQYEIKQDAKTPGAINAKKLNFEEYIRWRMSRHRDSSIRNFQAIRLSHMSRCYTENIKDQMEIQSHALATLEKLPFVGLVEKFDHSILLLAKMLERKGVKLKISHVQENVVTDISISTEERIQSIKDRLSNKTFRDLQEINAVDIKIYQIVKSWYS